MDPQAISLKGGKHYLRNTIHNSRRLCQAGIDIAICHSGAHIKLIPAEIRVRYQSRSVLENPLRTSTKSGMKTNAEKARTRTTLTDSINQKGIPALATK